MSFEYNIPLTGEQIFSLVYTDVGPEGGWKALGDDQMQKCLLRGTFPINANQGLIDIFLKTVSLPKAKTLIQEYDDHTKPFYVLTISKSEYDNSIVKNNLQKDTIIQLFDNAVKKQQSQQ